MINHILIEYSLNVGKYDNFFQHILVVKTFILVISKQKTKRQKNWGHTLIEKQ